MESAGKDLAQYGSEVWLAYERQVGGGKHACLT